MLKLKFLEYYYKYFNFGSKNKNYIIITDISGALIANKSFFNEPVDGFLLFMFLTQQNLKEKVIYIATSLQIEYIKANYNQFYNENKACIYDIYKSNLMDIYYKTKLYITSNSPIKLISRIVSRDRIVFLQHGYLYRSSINTDLYKYIVVSNNNYELNSLKKYKSIKNKSSKNEYLNFGLVRYNSYKKDHEVIKNQGLITLHFPLDNLQAEIFSHLEILLQHQLKNIGINLLIQEHSTINKQLKKVKIDNKRNSILSSNFFITDFSSMCFDFIYLEKPIFILNTLDYFDKNNDNKKHIRSIYIQKILFEILKCNDIPICNDVNEVVQLINKYYNDNDFKKLYDRKIINFKKATFNFESNNLHKWVEFIDNFKD